MASSGGKSTVIFSNSKCDCTWADCDALQDKLAVDCIKSSRNDVALGYYSVGATDQTKRLRLSIFQHLHCDVQVGKRLSIARHHWPRPLLEHNGNKEQTFKDEHGLSTTKLPRINGHEGNSIKYFFTEMESTLAISLGILQHPSNYYTTDVGKTFVQAPVATHGSVKDFVENLGMSSPDNLDRFERTEKRQAARVTPATLTDGAPGRYYTATTSLPTPTVLDRDTFNSSYAQNETAPLASEKPTDTQRFLCAGLLNPALNSFAANGLANGLANKGWCTEHFSWDRASRVWRSRHCTRIVNSRIAQCRLNNHNNMSNELTLVSREYFEFGLHILGKIRSCFNEETIGSLGTTIVDEAYKFLLADVDMFTLFLSCNNPSKNGIDEYEIRTLYEELLRKTFHARAGAETATFKQKNTSRNADEAVDTSLREGLKSLARRKSKMEKAAKPKAHHLLVLSQVCTGTLT
jgi:hypothetical protein